MLRKAWLIELAAVVLLGGAIVLPQVAPRVEGALIGEEPSPLPPAPAPAPAPASAPSPTPTPTSKPTPTPPPPAPLSTPGVPVILDDTGPASACSLSFHWRQDTPTYYFDYSYSRFSDFSRSVSTGRVPPGSGTYLPPENRTGPFEDTRTGAIPDTYYWFRIQACDPSTTCSEYATKALDRTPRLPDSAGLSFPDVQLTEALTVPAGTSFVGNYSFFWPGGVPGASGYGGVTVERAEQGGAFVPLASFVPLSSATPLQFKDLGPNDAGLNLSKYYSYRFRTYDSDKGCTFNPTEPATNLNLVVYSAYSRVFVIPARPDTLTVEEIAPSGSKQVRLTWQDRSSNESYFEVWRSTEATFPSAQTNRYTLPANTTTWTDTNVQTALSYFYRVRACTDAIACSAFSEIQDFSTISAPELFASVVYASGDTRDAIVHLSWRGVLGATGYRIERSQSADFPTPVDVLATVPDTAADYDDPSKPGQVPPGPVLGRTYYYRVVAIAGPTTTRNSNVATVNLRITKILHGRAWASIRDAGGPHGVGWINFNVNDEVGTCRSPANARYSVNINRDGLVTGLAWASVGDRCGGSGAGYGWLSFNPEDLQNCPVEPSPTPTTLPVTCEARLNSSNWVTGWARFYSTEVFGDSSAYSGWVRLTSPVPPPPPSPDGPPPPPPAPSFTFMMSNGGNRSVTQGQSVSNRIEVTKTGGSAQAVAFSVSGLPANSIGNFSNSSCIPDPAPCSTFFTVRTSESTPTGNFVIVVKGKAGTVEQSTQFTLTVTSGAPLASAPKPVPALSLLAEVFEEGPASSFAAIGGPVQSFIASLADLARRTAKVEPALGSALAEAPPAQQYGLYFDAASNIIIGQAWGADVVGWAAFSDPRCNGRCTVSVEVVGTPPAVDDVTVSEGILEQERSGPGWCSSVPSYVVYWDYSDPDDDPLSLASIAFIDTVTEEVRLVTVEPTDPSLTSSNQPPGRRYRYEIIDPLGYVTTGAYYRPGFLEPDRRYEVAVRAKDSTGTWSDSATDPLTWGGYTSASTPHEYLPLVNFSWAPTPITFGNPVTFTGTAVDRSNPRPVPPPPFDFTITNSGNQTVSAPGTAVGNIATALTTVGSGEPVAFAVSGAPSGVTTSFAPSGCTPSCSTALTFTATAAAVAGTYPIRVTASASGVSHATTFNLTVTASPPPPTSFNFSLTNGGDQSVVQGSSNLNSIIVAKTMSATAQTVTFSVSGLPANSTHTFSNSTCIPTPTTCSTFLTVQTTSLTPVGVSTIVVKGTAGTTTPIEQTTSYQLTVGAPKASPPPPASFRTPPARGVTALAKTVGSFISSLFRSALASDPARWIWAWDFTTRGTPQVGTTQTVAGVVFNNTMTSTDLVSLSLNDGSSPTATCTISKAVVEVTCPTCPPSGGPIRKVIRETPFQ